MEVQLGEMSEEAFKHFLERSIFDYANDLEKSSGITLDEALIRAQGELSEMRPDVLETKDNILRMIVDVSEEKIVGVIWYLFKLTDGIKQVFSNDFSIKEDERMNGYASVALREKEQDARRKDCVESVIYVRRHNLSGINLYTKCGYIAFRELYDGMYMKKA